MNTIGVIGLGCVGLPAAVIFASRGKRVVGFDIDSQKVEMVNKGISYINEPGLDGLLKDVVNRGLLEATNDGSCVVENTDAVIITVPTPFKEGKTDLTYIESALNLVKCGLHDKQLIVIESTIPPGTTKTFVKYKLEETGLRVEEDFYLAHVPERIAPGKAIYELTNEPRIIGGVGPKSTERAYELYSTVNKKLYKTDATTAEFVKLIENTFRDLNIAYANLLALMADCLDVDVWEAIELANTHPRVNIHKPGPGVGGSCLTKDPYMLVYSVNDLFGKELILISRSINEFMPQYTVSLIEKVLQENNVPRKSKIAVLGVAYKGNIGDTRESPAIFIVKELLKKGYEVFTYDPYTRESFGAISTNSMEEAIMGAYVTIIVTDHEQFKEIDLGKLKDKMAKPIIIDCRHLIDLRKAKKLGFIYYGIGCKRCNKNDNTRSSGNKAGNN